MSEPEPAPVMCAELNPIDSAAAGCNVVDLRGIEVAEGFEAFEREMVRRFAPAVAFCRIPAEQLAAVRWIEERGFRFAECQIDLRRRLRREDAAPVASYRWERVTSRAELDLVLELAGSIFHHDRFSVDPDFGPAVSRRRYRAFVEKSFVDPAERVFVMKPIDGGEVVSFATSRLVGAAELRLLLGGIAERWEGCGLGAVHDALGLAAYFAEGIRVVHSVVSAINAPILNLEVGYFRFRVVGAHLVFKKRYR